MKTNKKLYWLTFVLQFALAIFAFFYISDISWAFLVAIYINLLWFLCWASTKSGSYKRQELSFKVVICITIIILTLELITACYPSFKKLIDFFILLLFNSYLIVDDVIVLFSNKKD